MLYSFVSLFVGLYCSGWIAQGPVFVILGTMNDGFATGKTVLEDIASSQLTCENRGGKEAVLSLLRQKGNFTLKSECLLTCCLYVMLLHA